MSVLTLNHIDFAYEKSMVLKDLSFTFESGKVYAVTGKSGAGKTTLLSVLSGLAAPDGGEILYNDQDMRHINRYDFRRKYVGVIFQSYNLLTKLTAVENVETSMDIAGVRMKNKREKAYALLESVGLGREEADRRVLKLSGGQQQRVAIARALSYEPEFILADEPTGNLDEETQADILAIFRKLADEGKGVIIVTHAKKVADAADVVYELKAVHEA